jgi:glycosyltransferase involved in cell wall biosynthesis
MRVLAVTNLYPNPMQPHRAAFNRQQFRALAAEHEVQVIAPIPWTGELAGRLGDGGRPPVERLRTSDGMVIRHPCYAFTPRVLRRLYGQFFRASIRRSFLAALGEFRPDVVLGCWAYPDGWAAVRLAREAGLPVVVKVHGSDVLVAGQRSDRRQSTGEALSAADAVIAVSRDLRRRAVELGTHPSRVHVVHNGIDTGLFLPGPRDAARERLGIKAAEPLILFVGNLVPVKGPDVLLEALSLLAKGGGRFQCVAVGEGPMRERLRAQAGLLGLEQRVRFIGAQRLEQLPDWYRAADLLVIPSRSEGIPNVLLEAASCGTPFIASNVGGIPEVATEDALIPAGNAAALAERIQAALREPSRFGPAAEHRPGSWADSARAVADVLAQAIDGVRGRAARAA